MSTTAQYTVTGMTCAHCLASVTEEVQEIAGVTDVAIDLASGMLRVSSDHPIPDDAVRTAVEQAGYRVA